MRAKRASVYISSAAASVFIAAALVNSIVVDEARPWQMVTILRGQPVVGAVGIGTQEFDGADGVAFGLVDDDACPDLASVYEQGFRASVSYSPCTQNSVEANTHWEFTELPASAPNLCTVEDQALADLDSPADSLNDLVVTCELGGTARAQIFFHPAASDRPTLKVASNWVRVNVDAALNHRTMRVLARDMDGANGLDLLAGEKESSGPCVAANLLFYSTATPRTAASWVASTPIAPVGWVMNMYTRDVGGDGDIDILLSDRETIDCNPGVDNSKRGLLWYEQDPPGTWVKHQIQNDGNDTKWFHVQDWNGDGFLDISDCRSSSTVRVQRIWLADDADWGSFTEMPLPAPPNLGQCQHIVMQDFDLDGVNDIVMTASNSENFSSIGGWYNRGTPSVPKFERFEVSGGLGIKYDNILVDDSTQALHDVNMDGAPDICTTEQQVDSSGTSTGPGLGVICYLNPWR